MNPIRYLRDALQPFAHDPYAAGVSIYALEKDIPDPVSFACAALAATADAAAQWDAMQVERDAIMRRLGESDCEIAATSIAWLNRVQWYGDRRAEYDPEGKFPLPTTPAIDALLAQAREEGRREAQAEAVSICEGRAARRMVGWYEAEQCANAIRDGRPRES
jgi:hypothetical protein